MSLLSKEVLRRELQSYSPKSMGSLGRFDAPPSPADQCPKSPVGAHWWILSNPVDGRSSGVCKYCGAIREFDAQLSIPFRN